jgi:uncharacterized protein with ParB-like and HNH nuclease domain
VRRFKNGGILRKLRNKMEKMETKIRDPPAIRNWPISTFLAMKDDFKIDRNYQREEAWESLDKKWLIDTIFRNLPIPLIFIHKKDNIKWIVDGQQRLTTIKKFTEDNFELDEKVSKDIIIANNGKKKFTELKPEYREHFNRYQLPIVDLEEYKDEEIRSIYRRLQRGKPLNIAEILNASEGEIVLSMRILSKHKFFVDILPLTKKRYKYYHLVAIILFLEKEGIKDISPKNIYDFFDKNKNLDQNSKIYQEAKSTLNYLKNSLETMTPELRRPGWIITTYLLASHLKNNYVMNDKKKGFKKFIKNFYDKVRDSSNSGDSELINFNLLISKGTTSQTSLKGRYEIILNRALKEISPKKLDETRLFTQDQKRTIFNRDDEKCQVCGKLLKWGEKETQYHHKDRWVDGGKTETDKGLLVCQKCHLNKIHGIKKTVSIQKEENEQDSNNEEEKL